MAIVTASLSITSILLTSILALVVYLISTAIYRITLHPLASIPGPKLAAISKLYQTYWSYHNGESRFYKQIERLHDQYGPIVRITPNEVSLSDPANYEKIYSVGSKYYKDSGFYNAFGGPAAAFTTPSNELHRKLRAPLNPMFSRKVVLDLQSVVQEKVAKLCQRLDAALKAGTPGGFDVHYAFRAVSVDVVTDYAFNDCYNLLDKEDFGIPFFKMVKGTIGGFWVFMQSPLIQTIALGAPNWAIPNATIRLFNKFLDDTRDKIAAVKTRYQSGQTYPNGRTSIFEQLLNPDATPSHIVPSNDRLVDDAFIMLGAASDTTGNAMTIMAYNVMENPAIYSKLVEELQTAFPDDAPAELEFTRLEMLPYLTAVIKEGLRLSCGVVGRLPRVVPQPGAEFHGYTIPAGFVVGMSSWQMHHNASIFPAPFTFDPDRWLDVKQAKYLERYMVAFGKGSRSCIGINLAYCELYIAIGTLFRRFNSIQSYGVTPEDFVLDDFFGSYHPDAAAKLRIVAAPTPVTV